MTASATNGKYFIPRTTAARRRDGTSLVIGFQTLDPSSLSSGNIPEHSCRPPLPCAKAVLGLAPELVMVVRLAGGREPGDELCGSLMRLVRGEETLLDRPLVHAHVHRVEGEHSGAAVLLNPLLGRFASREQTTGESAGQHVLKNPNA